MFIEFSYKNLRPHKERMMLQRQKKRGLARAKEALFRAAQSSCYRLPLYESRISAGFPSPADDQVEERLDLNELLIKRPSATFFLKVSGSSMVKAGIHHGDIVVVDRSLEPSNGKIVIASLNGELTVKRLHIEGNRVRLIAESDLYVPIDISKEVDFRIWGVVTSVIHFV